jgi:hypothetical protein
MLPFAPIDHCVRNEANETLFASYDVHRKSDGLTPCFVILCWKNPSIPISCIARVEHSYFVKVTCLQLRLHPVKGTAHRMQK